VVTALAVARVGWGLALYASGQVDATGVSPLPLWAYALLSASFAAVGGGLVAGTRSDARAAWLGGVLVLLAVPLSERLVAREFTPTPEAIARLRPDTLLPAFLWRFVCAFPSSIARTAASVARFVAVLLTGFGLAALAATLSTVAWPIAGDADPRVRLLLNTRTASAYWPIAIAGILLALAVLAYRLATSRGADRFRLRVFVSGLLIGLAPLFVEVLVEELWPAYKALVHRPDIEPWVAGPLFVPMAVVPVVVAYSVLYDRVVETRVVLRLAAQYLLARATIIALSMVPFIGLALFLFERRAESLVALMSGPRPVTLGLTAALGMVALRLRGHWLRALDRRYFREHLDTQALLADLMAGDWMSQSSAAIAATLTRELDAAFHAPADLYVVDSAAGTLRSQVGADRTLDLRAMLVTLVTAAPQPMDVALTADSPLNRLPASEREWLAAGSYVLVVPLRTGSTGLIGVIALGPKRSEQAYSDSDRRALLAIATPVALALENDRLRSTPDEQLSPPAAECVSCSRLHAAEATACTCGGEVTTAAAPYLLRGVFRFERRLGAGGMGVVYLARDLALNRQVAIKTLPMLDARHEGRLRAEARAMASIVDANLATVHGIESWRGVPFLVEEFLEGGTLAQHMGRGPLPFAEALDLGVTLAAALERLHAGGLIHCDVKPSNIGFTRAGVPKLIDFGLARILRSAGGSLTSTTTTARTLHPATIVTDHGLVGTPQYMSPEALRASEPSPDFDVWALAVVLFEIVAGRRPFLGGTLAEVQHAILFDPLPDVRGLREDCSPQLAHLLQRCLSREPRERPHGARALRLELSALRAAEH
jgi:hypothetical protein